MLHQVNKLHFEATCSSEAEAFELQHHLAQNCQQQVADILDKVCSGMVADDEWIHINSIEIDLGNFDLASFNKNFPDVLLAKFEEEFLNILRTHPAPGKATSRQSTTSELLFYFLRTGTVPWWSDGEALNLNEVFQQVMTDQPESVSYFLESQKFNHIVWNRIAFQFYSGVHEMIISFFPNLVEARNKLIGWSQLAKQDVEDIGMDISINIISEASKNRFILENAPLFFKEFGSKLSQERLIKHFITEFAPANLPVTKSNELIRNLLAFEEKSFSKPGTESLNNQIIESNQELIPEIQEEIERTNKFNIKTAGIVLLAPYFSRFFKNLNLLENGDWKDRDSQYKAIHLVRFLSTGEQMCPEHTLVLEKVLCGLDINAPIPREIEITDIEIGEAIDLLASVISNWNKLKNTSVGGLRETFLKRDGILSKKDNDWLLLVERKTADVLMEDIPWSFSTLTFTWNSYTIFTEW